MVSAEGKRKTDRVERQPHRRIKVNKSVLKKYNCQPSLVARLLF